MLSGVSDPAQAGRGRDDLAIPADDGVVVQVVVDGATHAPEVRLHLASGGFVEEIGGGILAGALNGTVRLEQIDNDGRDAAMLLTDTGLRGQCGS